MIRTHPGRLPLQGVVRAGERLLGGLLRRPPQLGPDHAHIGMGRIAIDAVAGRERQEDVAAAVNLLLNADTDTIAGQSFHCCDIYIAAEDAARIAKDLTKSTSEIAAAKRGSKHQIDTGKLQRLGMRFSGRKRLETYIGELIAAIRRQDDRA